MCSSDLTTTDKADLTSLANSAITAGVSIIEPALPDGELDMHASLEREPCRLSCTQVTRVSSETPKRTCSVSESVVFFCTSDREVRVLGKKTTEIIKVKQIICKAVMHIQCVKYICTIENNEENAAVSLRKNLSVMSA